MISRKMKPLLNNNSAIRAMFEEGKILAKKYGRENVYDFSLGNPNVPAPKEVKNAILDILEEEDEKSIHGYMANAGYEDVREEIAGYINKKYDTKYSKDNLIMTVGAASALNISLKTMLNPDDEVICFAPYFVEYGNYINNYDGKLVVVEADTDSFMPNINKLKESITKKTRAIIINTPNNPTGVIYSDDILRRINKVLREAEKNFGIEIITISDEPYRELVYVDREPAWVPNLIEKTIVVYSYSKSLSLPGERIGWLLVSEDIDEFDEFVAALVIANRCIGSVNAPSLMQRVIKRCLDARTDIDYYKRNRDLLYKKLKSLGFEVVNPDGAFYMFVKVPENIGEKDFCDICKKYRILPVPGSAFACEGYIRLAYCVSYEMIERSFDSFEFVAKEVGLISK